MTRKAEAILNAALELSIDERSEVARGLQTSLGPPSHSTRDAEFWAHEINRRARAMDADPARGIDADQALEEVAGSLGLD